MQFLCDTPLPGVASWLMSGVKQICDGRQLLKIYRRNPDTAPLFKQVQEAHSHWQGNYYDRPKLYPVVYFDPDGYAAFQTETELRTHGDVQVDVHFSPPLRKLSVWRPLTPPPKQFKR